MIMILIRKLATFYGILKTKRMSGKLILKGKVNISGIPIYVIADGGKVIIGDNVSLKSNKKSYHTGMYSPVKLMADKPDARIEIGAHSRINGSCIHAYNEIKIGRNCLIAANCQIIDGSGHDLSMENPANRVNTTGDTRPINIEDNVWIGINCIVLPGVTIGKGSVIAAGSVVVKDIPPMSVAGGNPAKVIKQYEE